MLVFRNSKIVVLFFLLFTLTNVVHSQSDSRSYRTFYSNDFYSTAERITKARNSFSFMPLRQYLGALNVMIKATKESELIDQQITLVNNLINSSQVSNTIGKNTYKFKDEFRGWVVLKADEGNKGTINKEVPLFESYSFFYVSEFLYILKEMGWVDQSIENRKWWEDTVQFVEQNIWTKWRTRSYKESKMYDRTFLRNRTHMGSHWAGVASYLNKITYDDKIKEQTIRVVQQYDRLLRRNLKIRRGAYVWNSTYDNVSGTEALGSSSSIIQDVSHGNHVISYVVAAYELGNTNWTKRDLRYFSKTVTKIMYDARTNTFSDNVDGTVDKSRPGLGNNVGDGWVKLGNYDKQVKKTFRVFSENEKSVKKYNQELQFKAVVLAY